MNKHRLLGVAAAVLALGAVVAGEPAPSRALDLDAIASDVANERDHVDAPALAQWIRYRRPGLRVIDVRDSAAFDQMHIPSAERMDVDAASHIDAPLDAPIVLYSEGGTHAAQVWFMLRARGFSHVYFLREGLYEWTARVMTPMLPSDATPAESASYRIDAEMSRYFGGTPKRGVARSDMPDGYWLHDGAHHDTAAPSHDAVIEKVRRRGC